MKKFMTIVAAMAVFMAVSPAQKALCTGIPVYDASNMLNQLRDYLQQMQQYTTAVNSNVKLTQQYIQMVRDYQQKLREYQHYLNQMKSVRHMIETKDWRRMLQTIKYYYGKSKRSVIVESGPDDPNYEKDLNTVLEQYGYVPRDPADVERDARDLGIWNDEFRDQVRRDYDQYELYKDRIRMVSRNQKESQDRVDDVLSEHSDTVNNLNDEDDIATMQAIAAQNITKMNQMEHLIRIQNQVLLNMEIEQAKRAAAAAKWRDQELDRLQNRKANKLLGRDRWGQF